MDREASKPAPTEEGLRQTLAAIKGGAVERSWGPVFKEMEKRRDETRAALFDAADTGIVIHKVASDLLMRALEDVTADPTHFDRVSELTGDPERSGLADFVRDTKAARSANPNMTDADMHAALQQAAADDPSNPSLALQAEISGLLLAPPQEDGTTLIAYIF